MNNLFRGRFLKRIFSIKLLAIGWLVVAIFGGLRFAGSLSNWDLILSFGEPVLPLYLTISGFVWAIAGLVCACGLWLRHIWAGWLNVFTAVLFAIWYWLDRIFLTRSETARENFPFAIITTLVVLFTVGTVLALNLRNNRES